MTAQEAIKALELNGGLEINGNAIRVARFFEGLDMAIKALEKQVPVVHGEWIRNENPIETSCECSVCHAKDYWYDIDKANEYYWFHRNFCPKCGAKMDGGKE